VDLKRASFVSQLGVNCKPKEHVLGFKRVKKSDKKPLPLTPPPREGE